MGLLTELSRIAKPKANLYKFTYNNIAYLFTDNSRAITYQDQIYQPGIIASDEIVKTNNNSFENNIKIEVSINFPLLKIWRTKGQSERIFFELIELNLKDYTEKNIRTKGEIIGHNTENEKGILIATDFSNNLNVLTLQYYYSRLCPFSQYEKRCGLNFNAFAYVCNIINISADRKTLTVDSLPPDVTNYKMGLIKNNYNEKQMIENINSVTKQIVIDDALSFFVQIGDVVRIAPTCSYIYTKCESDFNNLDRFGGFIGIDSNPFENGKLK